MGIGDGGVGERENRTLGGMSLWIRSLVMVINRSLMNLMNMNLTIIVLNDELMGCLYCFIWKFTDLKNSSNPLIGW